MKRLASKFITGILLLTTICTGSIAFVMEAQAQTESTAMVSHNMEDESVNCCDDHEHEAKVMAQQLKEKQNVKLKAWSVFPKESLISLAVSYPDQDARKGQSLSQVNQHLRTIVLLE